MLRNQIYEILEKHFVDTGCSVETPDLIYWLTGIDFKRDSVKDIFDKLRDDREKWADYGSEMMASQIRKSIETGKGRFSNENANWTLDQLDELAQYREMIDELRKKLADKEKCCKVCDKEAMDEINAYESMFEELETERKCTSCFAGLKCTVCGGTGKITRPLTMKESGKRLSAASRIKPFSPMMPSVKVSP